MCDTMVRVLPDRVLFAKNSDRDPNEAQVLDWHGRRQHPPGSTLACTWLTIPQVPHTHAVLLSRPFWMWGAEMGANEHGVVIGNEAVFTDQPYAPTGLTGMDLVRLGLERATSAEEAASVIIDLLEVHGQGGGCGLEDRGFTYHNSFLIADRDGAVVVETAGRLWATEQVDAGARSISNGLTIPGFAGEHADRLRGGVARCGARRALTEARAATSDGAHTWMQTLRSHGPDDPVGPRWSPVNGAMGAPCMHAGGLVAASQTTASWVSELSADGARHWATGTAAPCTSLFKPVDVHVPVDTGPAPIDVADPHSLWWRHEHLHRRVLRDPERLLPALAAERDDIERSWVRQRPASPEAFAEADRWLQGWIDALPAAIGDRRPAAVRRYWRTRDQRAGMWSQSPRRPTAAGRVTA